MKKQKKWYDYLWIVSMLYLTCPASVIEIKKEEIMMKNDGVGGAI